MELNREQKRVLEKDFDDAAKIMAGAGTGKTRVLVALYLKFLLEYKIPPERLLALTFTNKAAAEMKKRIFEKVKAVGDKRLLRGLYDSWIMNFHSFGHRILTESAPSFGIDPSFDVAGLTDTVRLERLLLEKFESGTLPGMPEDFGEDMPQPGRIRGEFEKILKIIDRGRSMLLKPEDILQALNKDDFPGYKTFIETLAAVWKIYRSELHRRQLIDFDDMIELVVKGFEENPEVRRRYSSQFDQILVDEYQDTSEAQNELLRLLSGGDFRKITIVGDEKQSIYRWRNARVENIRRFPGKPFVLRKNYRSSQGILDLALRFICMDGYFREKREEIRLEADRKGEEAPIVIFHPDEKEGKSFESEAIALVAWIRSLTEGIHIPGMPRLIVPEKDRQPLRFEDITILLRSLGEGSGLIEYENAFREHGIPYAVVGGANTVEVKALQIFLALLSIVVEPRDIHSLLVVLEAKPFSIGDAALAELFEAVNRKLGVAGSAEDNGPDAQTDDVGTDILFSDENLSGLSDGAARKRCELLRGLIDNLRQKNARLDLRTFLIEAMEDGPLFYQLLENGYTPRLALNLSKELLREVEELTRRNETTLPVFLERLRKKIEAREFENKNEAVLPPACVRIMTIHQAKGLEFPAVAVSGIKPPKPENSGFYLSKTRGLFLSQKDEWARGYKNLDERETERSMLEQEERCLRYVAMTRAKEYLFVSSPHPEGIAGGRRTFLADVLENIREGGINGHELRHAPEIPGKPASPTDPVETVSMDGILGSVERWKSARYAVESVRNDLPGGEAAVRFVNWKALKMFYECPRKYYYRYVTGLAEEFAELGVGASPHEALDEKGEDTGGEFTPRGVEPAAYGIFIHKVLDELLRKPHLEREDSGSRLETLFNRSGISKKHRAGVIEAASKIVEAFLRSDLNKGDDVEYLETPFAVRLKRIIFRGVFDRVDRTEGGYRVVDYKAGVPKEEYEFQVRFYAWILGKVDGEKPVEGELAYLGNEVRIQTVDTGVERMQAIEALAARLEETTASGRYDTSPGETCSMCPYCWFCPSAPFRGD